MKNRYIGMHLSISGGLYKAVEKAEVLEINAMQIFLKNSNRWIAKDYSEEDITRFKESLSNLDMALFAHTAYLINPSSVEDEVFKKSLNALTDELNRASLLGVPYLVLHPGSHKGNGEAWGINRVSRFLDESFNKSDSENTMILLENTAGQGNNLGYNFKQLGEIIEKCSSKDRLGICFDTCHAYAAGYDLKSSESVSELVKEIKDFIGLNKLKLIHLNDSKNEKGTRKDRHEHIGKGYIGMDGFKIILNHPDLKKVPLILETPKDKDDEFKFDKLNIETVKKIIE